MSGPSSWASLGWNWCVSYRFVFPTTAKDGDSSSGSPAWCVYAFKTSPSSPLGDVLLTSDWSERRLRFPDRSCCSQCEAAARLDESTVVMNYWATLKMNISYGSRRVGNVSPNPWCPFRSWSRPSPAPVCTLMQVPLPSPTQTCCTDVNPERTHLPYNDSFPHRSSDEDLPCSSASDRLSRNHVYQC